MTAAVHPSAKPRHEDDDNDNAYAERSKKNKEKKKRASNNKQSIGQRGGEKKLHTSIVQKVYKCTALHWPCLCFLTLISRLDLRFEARCCCAGANGRRRGTCLCWRCVASPCMVGRPIRGISGRRVVLIIRLLGLCWCLHRGTIAARRESVRGTRRICVIGDHSLC
jgi:hypothetical protein